jgi:Uma2 family endonuclease
MATTEAPPRTTIRAPHRFTVDEYHRMADAGILTPDDRVELLDGVVVDMSPIGDPHVEAVSRCEEAFAALLVARRVRYSTQNPFRVDRHNEPQPDFALVRPGVVGAPRPGDLLLAVEVADTSVADDRVAKVPLYARAGVPETWLLNVRDRALEVYREPGPAGYAQTHTYQPNQRVAAAAFPELVLRVGALLPPPDLERWRDREAERGADRDPLGGRDPAP